MPMLSLENSTLSLGPPCRFVIQTQLKASAAAAHPSSSPTNWCIVCSYGSDQEKAGHSRRRSLREDLSPDCVQQGPVPRGLCAHGVRKLRC